MTLKEYLLPAYIMQEQKTEIEKAGGKVRARAKLEDGKFLFGGDFEMVRGVRCNGIARFNKDGNLDTTFRAAETKLDNSVNCIAVQPDGKIIVAGIFEQFLGYGRYRIIRLNTDGSLDTSFIAGKWIDTAGFDDSVDTVVIQKDGKILVGGRFDIYNGVERINIARLNTDGTLDLSFKQELWQEYDELEHVNSVRTLILQEDEKVLVYGSMNINTEKDESQDEIVRLNSDGTEDPTFNLLRMEKDRDYFKIKQPLYSHYVMEGRFMSWAFVMECKTEENTLNEFPELLKRSKEFRACPECGIQPENLTWLRFSTPNFTWLNLAGSAGYIGVCELCNRQVGYLETMCN